MCIFKNTNKLIYQSAFKRIYKVKLSKFKKMKYKCVRKYACKVTYNNIDHYNKMIDVYNKLNHININVIIKLYYHNKCFNKYNLYFEYCNADLYDWLIVNYKIYKTLSVETFFYFIIRMCKTLKYIHSKGIIHTDIKLENIGILDENINNTRLLDFDSCIDLNMIEEDYIPTEYIQGTKHFKAPEVLKYKRIKRNKLYLIDYYSLGVCIYCLAYERYPDEIEDDNKLFQVNNNVRGLPHVLPQVKTIIDYLLEEKSHKREKNVKLLLETISITSLYDNYNLKSFII